ncbi:MAG TPA: hypothetical protein DD000_08735 [Cyanobacteria bacterium UBA11166]|nr:hypothetical protein [Cyanobacteria bacterium UBA11166]
MRQTGNLTAFLPLLFQCGLRCAICQRSFIASISTIGTLPEKDKRMIHKFTFDRVIVKFNCEMECSEGVIFVRDLIANTTRRISVNSNGIEGNGWSVNPSISADGRYVGFESYADNLVRWRQPV